ARAPPGRGGPIGMERRTMPSDIEVDLVQRVASLDRVPIGVDSEPGLQLGTRRWRGRRAIDDELELLRDPSSHHGVVAIEPHRDPFAVEDLLAHPALDTPLQFFGRRRALARALELRLQALQLAA